MAQVRRILAITADPVLQSAAQRLGALVGATVERRSEAARSGWAAADAVIVGADLVQAVVASRPARRPGVLVLAGEGLDDGLWRSAVRLGAAGVFAVPGEEREVVELLGCAFEPAPAASSVIAVTGACGGAGTSTLAAGLALTSAATWSTVLIDGDRLGGGLDLLLGIEQLPGLRWPDLASTRGRLPSESFAQQLPAVAGCAVLSWDRAGTSAVTPEAAAVVIEAATRAFTTVVVDLQRISDSSTEVLGAAADRVIVLTVASVRAIAATRSVLADLTRWSAPVDLVLRDPGGAGLSRREVERAVGVPVRLGFGSESAVAAAAERGDLPTARPRGALARACRELLDADLRASA